MYDRKTVLFAGTDASGNNGLWATDGSVAGTYELTGISGAYTGSGGFAPGGFTVFNGEVLFAGVDDAGAEGRQGLWVTNVTGAGTYELTGISNVNPGGLRPNDLTVFNGEVLFAGLGDNYSLWVTNGTAAGTSEISGIANTGDSGLEPTNLTVFNGNVLFAGTDASDQIGLWITNGTAAGTSEIGGITGAEHGLAPADITVFNGEVLFNGVDRFGPNPSNNDLWVSNGTAAGTRVVASNTMVNSLSLNPSDITVFNGEALFNGIGEDNVVGLWVFNGTTASELTGINGVWSGSGNANPGLYPEYMTVFNGEVLFNGRDASGGYGLWVTNGTAGGTSELGDLNDHDIAGSYSGGLDPSNFTVFDGKALFRGRDASGNFGLWVTDGTINGTRELTGINGANSSGLAPYNMTSVALVIPPSDDFTGNNTSDILFINTTSGDTWFEAISNGAPSAPHPWQEIGGSDTHYAVLGVGDFYGTGSTDILFRNTSTGDSWLEAISNGAFAGWHQIGGSDTHYSVAGVGDFTGYGTSDILFRNDTSGDTWFEAISNGSFAGWHQIGGSDTTYSVVGIGDFYGAGTDDILFRNNSTGDTWFEQMTNGAFAGWHQIGGSDTHYSVVGVGDFFGYGTNDILFRNNSTGDTWFEAISGGAFAGWHQIGGSDTTYSVVGVGDYFGTNTSDILFRNSAGDTWVEAISNGAFAGWSQIGGSNTSYSVPVTVGPPALT